jgi:hypothetical protein
MQNNALHSIISLSRWDLTTRFLYRNVSQMACDIELINKHHQHIIGAGGRKSQRDKIN